MKSTFFNAYVFRSDRRSTFDRPFANRWLNIIIIGEIVLPVVMITLPPLRNLFGMSVLSEAEWMIALLVSASVVPVLEVAKRFTKLSI